MKKVFSLVLAMMMFAAFLPAASAAEVIASGTCGENLTWVLDGDGTLTVSGTGEMKDFTTEMLDTAEELYAVTPWRLHNEKIMSVVIENGVTRIGDNAFDNAQNLKEVVLPESLTSIGSFAFDSAKSLTKVVIPEGVTSIEHWVFRDCEKLESVTIPESMTEIGNGAFAYSGLRKIYIPAAVTQVGDEVVSYCPLLTEIQVNEANESYKSYDGALFDKSGERLIACPGGKSGEFNVPDGVKKISNAAFSGCFGLEAINVGEANEHYRSHDGVLFNKMGSVLIACPMGKSGEYNVPYGVKEIGDDAFANCVLLTDVKIPDSVEVIYGCAFLGCKGITNIEIPESVDTIREYAFADCDGFTEIVIPEGVKEVSWGAFSYCDKLSAVTIPTSVEALKTPFEECPVLRDVYYRGSREQWEKLAYGSYEYPVENAEVHYLNEEKPEAIDETTIVMVYDSGSCGEALTWEIDSRGTLTISGTGEMKEFGYDEVTPWDDYSKKIRTVVLKDGVTSISREAFINCVNLTSVDVPKSVTRVGEDAFLKTMYYSDEKNWENGVLYVGSALVKAKSEEVKGEYVIKDGTTTISERAFDCCVDLTGIEIPESVVEIGTEAFRDCVSLREITIPKSVEIIQMEAFAECTSLKKVSILGEEVDIEYGAFEYCENLSDIEIPGSEAELGCYVFPDTAYYDDEKNWDNGVLYVGNILAATRSEEVKGAYTVREGTRCIADRAFYGCDNLTSITIPKSVTNIGVLQFEGCSSLTAINIESGCENYESRDGVLYGKVLKNLIQCPMKKGGKLVIPKGAVEKIEDEAFGYCTEIEEVIIPEGVTEIGDYAFLNCKNLKSVTIPESVESIGYGAFGNCESLESVIIPKKVESIKDYTFIGCGSLKSVTIPEGVKSIGALAFEECGKLSEAIIPESVTVIGNQAFDGCGSLKKVNIPKGVKVIPEAAFARCESLTDVVIPESVEFIVDSAFADCGSLEKIEIPKGANIGSYAFARCESLKSVSLSEGMESVEYGTFTGCKSLTDIVIPESVTSIGYDAFFECENLKNISFPKGITFVGNGALLNTAYYSDEKNWDNGVLYIGSVLVKAKGISGVYKVGDNVTCIAPYAFEECSNMTGVIIPVSVTRIGEGAFLNTAYYNDEKNRDNGVLYSGNILIEANGDDVGVNYSVKNGTVMIADRAFAWNGNIIRISIPESVKLIGEEALYEVYQDISDVYFGGTEEEWRALEERSGSLGLTEEARVHYNSGIKE